MKKVKEARYLGVTLDEEMIFIKYMVLLKMNQIEQMVFQQKLDVMFHTKSSKNYYDVFEQQLRQGCQILGQNPGQNHVNREAIWGYYILKTYNTRIKCQESRLL